jgi:hypothetical protein
MRLILKILAVPGYDENEVSLQRPPIVILAKAWTCYNKNGLDVVFRIMPPVFFAILG